jgi:hypothetical protein
MDFELAPGLGGGVGQVQRSRLHWAGLDPSLNVEALEAAGLRETVGILYCPGTSYRGSLSPGLPYLRVLSACRWASACNHNG